MSDCGVCIGGYDCDGSPEFHRSQRPKARKEHKCEDCERVIARGQFYDRQTGKFDGELYSTVTCLVCVEIRRAFTCAEYDQTGPPAGELWSDIEEMMFPQLTTACFAKLETPEAKAYMRERWMAWKGLSDAPKSDSAETGEGQ